MQNWQKHIEFVQGHENEQEKNDKKKLDGGRPDMLAVRFENGKPAAFVFVELKTKKEACGGKTGVIPHLENMCAYIKSEETQKNMDDRRSEAVKVMGMLHELGLAEGEMPASLEGLPTEILLLFTGTAAEWEQKHRKELEEVETGSVRVSSICLPRDGSWVI